MSGAAALLSPGSGGSFVVRRAAVLLSLFILAPIYLITLAAFSTTDAVYTYPKELLPRDLSTETMSFFLHFGGVLDALQRSVYVALITLVLALAIGTPAGYALARFAFRGGGHASGSRS